MNMFRALTSLFAPAAPRFSDVALGNLTDTQLRRAGLSKAEMLHNTFSGLTTCG